jgi:6-phosphogluconolactonase
MGHVPEVVVVEDASALEDAAGARIEKVAFAATRERPATISLAGGSTPRAAYMRLASRPIPWGRVELFFGDERCVPPDDPASNYGMARDALLERVPADPARVHRIRGEIPPYTAAAEAEAALRHARPGVWPAVDLLILGIGEDGHCASIFPGSPALAEATRAFVPAYAPWLPQPWRVTMTLPAINAAKEVIFLVDGENKAPVVARAIAGDPALPSGLVRPAGRLIWIVTQSAAGDLG